MNEKLKRIIEVMEEQNITQAELCEKIGLKKASFTNWKAGQTESYIKYLPQIAGILNCSVDYLATGKETEAEELWRAFCAAPERVRVGIRVILGID